MNAPGPCRRRSPNPRRESRLRTSPTAARHHRTSPASFVATAQLKRRITRTWCPPALRMRDTDAVGLSAAIGGSLADERELEAQRRDLPLAVDVAEREVVLADE